MTEKNEPETDKLDSELETEIDRVLVHLSVLGGMARERGRNSLMYATNRAWRELDNGREADVTNEVEQALRYADAPLANPNVKTLAAEVRRLREENADVNALLDRAIKAGQTHQLETERLQKVVAELKDYGSRLDAECESWRTSSTTLREENATLRGLLCQHGDGTQPASDEQDLANLRRWKSRVEQLETALSNERSLTAAAAEHTAAFERRVAWLDRQTQLQTVLIDALMEQNEQAYDWVAFRELSRWRQNNPEPKP